MHMPVDLGMRRAQQLLFQRGGGVGSGVRAGLTTAGLPAAGLTTAGLTADGVRGGRTPGLGLGPPGLFGHARGGVRLGRAGLSRRAPHRGRHRLDGDPGRAGTAPAAQPLRGLPPVEPTGGTAVRAAGGPGGRGGGRTADRPTDRRTDRAAARGRSLRRRSLRRPSLSCPAVRRRLWPTRHR
ncbi:hypothetical protein GXW82_40735 [Streptacidiphilus sp. 4-A2]|nr:hypothetical protein [Streptacidiphilus sp. 4-A2]